MPESTKPKLESMKPKPPPHPKPEPGDDPDPGDSPESQTVVPAAAVQRLLHDLRLTPTQQNTNIVNTWVEEHFGD